MPDVGLLTLTEMADNAARIVDASGLPLISDADNGYGGPLSVRRVVREYVRAGVAAMHLEDQVLPKRCGHMGGKAIVPVAEMVGKIRAAVDARQDPDFVIIARTDAIAVEGFEAALERAARYAEAGADMLFVEAPVSMEQLADIPRRLPLPQLFNMSVSGKTPLLSASEIAALGFKLAIYPNWALLAGLQAAAKALGRLRATGAVQPLLGSVTGFNEFYELLGMKEVQELEERYGIDEDKRVKL
jgi:2-methylisocitrate lyase-like PEP mutase family enzyme